MHALRTIEQLSREAAKECSPTAQAVNVHVPQRHERDHANAHGSGGTSPDPDSRWQTKFVPGDSLADKLLEALRRATASASKPATFSSSNTKSFPKPKAGSSIWRPSSPPPNPSLGRSNTTRRPRHRTGSARKPRRHPPQERRADHRDPPRFSLRQQRHRCLQRRWRHCTRCCCRKIRTAPRANFSAQLKKPHGHRHSGHHH